MIGPRKGPRSRGLQSKIPIAFDRHGDVVELLGDRGTADVHVTEDDIREAADLPALFDRLLARSDGGRR